jgi:signal transduction histidine kinase/CheY-like chemotaxis protein/purine-cytosine permease-like protein
MLTSPFHLNDRSIHQPAIMDLGPVVSSRYGLKFRRAAKLGKYVESRNGIRRMTYEEAMQVGAPSHRFGARAPVGRACVDLGKRRVAGQASQLHRACAMRDAKGRRWVQILLRGLVVPLDEHCRLQPLAIQRIVKVRRDYNTWVANETMEDYALRFTPRSFRKWSPLRVGNTAVGAVAFLALEAIGGSVALNYGFTNAAWAILSVSLVVFLTGLPISIYAARHGVDMDLLTRGAGFGYIGSTITSLIYASFTFIFFALEAAIMALALQLWFGLPLPLGYLVSSLVVLPIVTHGVTLISALQIWTQPVWLVMLAMPYVAIALTTPDTFAQFATFGGRLGNGPEFDLLLFGAASAVAFSLIAQIGEQVDFLRFLPEKTHANRGRWWGAVLAAGPGWILPGAAKMLGGAFLAFLALQHEIPIAHAMEPTQMYLVGFSQVFANPAWALAATGIFVIVSQMKINVTNAYAGSLAWSNFFARLTHSHPGRVVWVVFNVLIALLLMMMGVFGALERVLSLYSNVAIAWVGVVVADLVINKPLGLSPKGIEFRRAYLYDINPVGVGAMLIASGSGIAALSGSFGDLARAFSPFIALATAFVCTPAIAWLTGGRYYIARPAESLGHGAKALRCSVCDNSFEVEDMASCPAYGGAICSLCCTLDARCQDRCKPGSRASDRLADWLHKLLPGQVAPQLNTRISRYFLVLLGISALLAGIMFGVFYQESAHFPELSLEAQAQMRSVFLRTYAVLFLMGAVAAWWFTLTHESRLVAQEESNRQTQLLMREIDAHRATDAELQRARKAAEAMSQAKSRYVTGISHELRSPLNSILGYAQILQKDEAIPPHRREAIAVMRRSGEHLLSLIDGALDIARIEAGKLHLEPAEVRLNDFLQQIVDMFRPQAAAKGLAFEVRIANTLPQVVHADVKRLRQIVINLLGNAIKFTERGTVTLGVSYRFGIARMEVADTGVGIPKADLQRIFLPFERSSISHSHLETGTGLGLAITKLLAEIMGGEIHVESTLGIGSTFVVRIYLPEVQRPVFAAQPEADIVGYGDGRKTILVVDDQTAQRQLLAELLRPLGFIVVEAGSGEECLCLARLHAPHAILMDIAMPEMDGWETCRRLRQSYSAHVPILMVSANAADNVQEKLAMTGSNGFIVKPVMEAELLSKLGACLALEWTYRASKARAVAGNPGGMPDAPRLAALRRLCELGYVKGILQELEQVERDAPDCATFVAEARRLANSFQLDQFMHLLTKADHAV